MTIREFINQPISPVSNAQAIFRVILCCSIGGVILVAFAGTSDVFDPIDWAALGTNILVLGFSLVLILMAAAFYFIPTLHARDKKHHLFGPIFIVNLFFGWTLIGWVGALVMALWPTPAGRGSK